MRGFLILSLLIAIPAGAAELVVTDLKLVDPVAREIRPASLYIDGGRFAAIGAPDGAEFAGEIRRWSASGRFALPSMLDASTFAATQVSPGHRDEIAGADVGLLFRAAGVHRYLDLGPGDFSALRGGPVLISEGGVGSNFPGARPVRDAADGRIAVAEILSSSRPPQRLSVVFDRGRSRRGLTVEVLQAILDEAGATPVAVYVGTWRDAYEALEAGATWIVQIPPGPAPEPVLELIRSRRPAWIPTIAVGSDFMALMANPELREDPGLVRSLTPEMRADYGEVRVPQARLTEARLQNEDRLAALAQLSDAGAVLVAGSQSGGLGTAHGWSLVRELGWWLRAGLEPWDILAAATIHGAELLGLEVGWTEGASADFTLYESSPATNPGILGSPELVFSRGVAETPDAIVAGVRHALTEEVPDNPLPGGNRWSLLILAVLGFAVLLGLRHLVKRAAANAAES